MIARLAVPWSGCGPGSRLLSASAFIQLAMGHGPGLRALAPHRAPDGLRLARGSTQQGGADHRLPHRRRAASGAAASR